MIVLKFGGTSVGTSRSIKQVVQIIAKIKEPKLVVLSAVSGTTNSLIVINELIKAGAIGDATLGIHQLQSSYFNLISELYSTSTYKERARSFIAAKFSRLKALAKRESRKNLYNIIVAQGEILSTNLVQLYLEEYQISSSLISALEFVEVDENNEPKLSVLTGKITPILAKDPNQSLWITQGFICKDNNGEISNLQRGGSDYTASLIGAAIQADEIQIWTDINGMQNNDPRYVENTFSVEEVSFDEAAELAYFGAKILHPQSLIPAKENNIPVWLKNTFSPASKGTIIRNKSVNSGVTAIAAKDGITAIKIKSYRMLMAYGFLKNVFEVFEKHQTPIDMITTSEVAVSLTIDNTNALKKITDELNAYGKVEVDTGLSIVCVAGDFSQNKEGISALVFNSLKDIPIRMISYGGSNYNVSLLVKSTDKKAALNSLNKGLFPKKQVLQEI